MTEKIKQQATKRSVIRRIWPIVLTQICTSAAVGLNLTVAALAAVEVTGREDLGGLAQTSTIIGATVITMLSTRLAARTDRLFSLRCTISLAVFGSLICFLAVSLGSRFGWILFCGLFLLGGGTVSTLISRFVATEKVGLHGKASSAVSAVLFGSAIGSLVGPNIYGVISSGVTSAIKYTFIGSAVIFALGLIPLSLEKCKEYSVDSPKQSKSRKRDRITWEPAYTFIFFVAIAAHSTMVSLMAMAPIYTDRTFGPFGSGAVMTAHLLGMYAFGPAISLLFDRLGTKLTVAVGAGVFVASAISLIFCHGNFIVFLLGLFGVGVSWSVGMITSSTLVSRISDSGQRIAIQGRLDVSINIAAGVSSICSGAAVAVIGYPALAAGNIAILCIATLILVGFQAFRNQ